MGPIKVAVRNPGKAPSLVQPTIKAIRTIAEVAKVEVSEVEITDTSANFVMFFDENELTYYVTLHQDTALSRALKTIDLASAESVFLADQFDAVLGLGLLLAICREAREAFDGALHIGVKFGPE